MHTNNITFFFFQSKGFQLSHNNTSVQVKRLDWACDTYDSDVDVVVAAGKCEILFKIIGR